MSVARKSRPDGRLLLAIAVRYAMRPGWPHWPECAAGAPLRAQRAISLMTDATSSGVADKIDRNVRHPCSRRLHDERLPVAFGANRQQGRDGVALDLAFDNTVNVLPRNPTALAILAFKPVARKDAAFLIYVGIQIHFVGVAGAADIHRHGLARILGSVVDFAADTLARSVR